MTVDELAAAIRAYVGPRIVDGPTRDAPRWYIDINSMVSDEEIRTLAEGIIQAADLAKAESTA